MSELLLCCECGKPATWVRHTQFSGDYPFCTVHAVAEDGFGDEDSSYFVWEQVSSECMASECDATFVPEQLGFEVHRMPPEHIAVFYRQGAEELRRQAIEARAAADVARTVLFAEAARAADVQAELFLRMQRTSRAPG